MRITIWHNVHRDHYDGYERHHPMLRVFSYIAPAADPEAELWRAVHMFNAPRELLAPGDRGIAAAYRQRELRSFSTGDGFSVLQDNAAAERFWTSDGLQLLPQETAFERLGIEGRSASKPLGQPISYMIPVLGDGVREGLFEVGDAGSDDLRKAVAVHHGVPLAEVVIIPSP